ncbi:MAG: alkaline phosphatase family protein [Muribaculaceae bacterium]|nr:alkaline phosphatase family protein [Muribaculaceae bacterium]
MTKDTEISLSRRLMLALIASMVTMAIPAQTNADKKQPQLLLNVVIEGLDATQLDLLRDYFGQDGFNRLLSQGVVLSGEYGTALDPTAAVTELMTGASPSVTGVSSASRFDRRAMRSEHIFDDGSTLGNYTNSTYSPGALLVSTLSDEARIAGGGVTQVYAVAPDPGVAIALGGHSANCAMWIDDRNGNWATTTFYKDPPSLLGSRNRLSHLSQRLDTMCWTPLLEADRYPGLPEHLTHYPFRYAFGRSNTARFAEFKDAPGLVNTEVTSMAVDLISTLRLGQHNGLDVLSVAYTLNPYEGGKNPDTRYELIDSYYRLDADLARLVKAAEKQAGANASVVMITGTPPSSRTRRDDPRWMIPYGEFSTRKAMSLLNVYLIALHGNGEWVQAYSDGWFYLNDKLIEERKADATVLRAEAAVFLSRMAGVKAVHTSDDVRHGRAGANPDALRRNTHFSTCGDMLLEVLPGWQLTDDSNPRGASSEKYEKVQRETATTAPVIIMAPGLAARLIHTPVDIRMVTPTVCRLLRIRSPNAASMPAINL